MAVREPSVRLLGALLDGSRASGSSEAEGGQRQVGLPREADPARATTSGRGVVDAGASAAVATRSLSGKAAVSAWAIRKEPDERNGREKGVGRLLLRSLGGVVPSRGKVVYGLYEGETGALVDH